MRDTLSFAELFQRYVAELDQVIIAASEPTAGEALNQANAAFLKTRGELIETEVTSEADSMATVNFLAAELKAGTSKEELQPLIVSLNRFLDRPECRLH